MSKRIKSKKYTGVYYRELVNGHRCLPEIKWSLLPFLTDCFIIPISSIIQGDSYRLKEKKEQGILNSDIYKIEAKSLDQSKQKTEVV